MLRRIAVDRPHFRALNPDKVEEPPTPEAARDPALRRQTWEEKSEANPFEAFAAPRAGEPVVEKHTFDGFAGTELASILRGARIEQTLLCGLVTSACVQATAHGAFAAGFAPAVVADACGDRSRARHEAVFDLYAGPSNVITERARALNAPLHVTQLWPGYLIVA